MAAVRLDPDEKVLRRVRLESVGSSEHKQVMSVPEHGADDQ